MNLIKNIIKFFKTVFHKDNSTKMIETPVENIKEYDKADFIDSLKVNITKKKKVETLTCFGDGLGIQNKITY